MAYTYDDFMNAANSSGMLPKIAQSDLELAKQYPEFGLSLLSLTKDMDGAVTAEQKLLASEAAEQLRSAYGKAAGSGSLEGQIVGLKQQAANYGAFSYNKENAYQKALAAATNPAPFAYDLENDPVYSAYRKQYLREGERAVADTLARVSAATGGRPSSYAVTAAQQAGDYYNAQLTDVIPTLYQNAYQRYLNDLGQQKDALDILMADRKAAQSQHLSNYELILAQLEQLQAQKEAQDALLGVGDDQVPRPANPTVDENAVGNFKSSYMTLNQALSRGITRKEWLAYITQALNGLNLTDDQFAELEKYYGIG